MSTTGAKMLRKLNGHLLWELLTITVCGNGFIPREALQAS